MKRTHLLDEMLKKRFPKSVPTRWSSKSKLVAVVETNIELLIDYFKTITDSPADWDKNTSVMAMGFLTFLQSPINLFLVLLFRAIFREVDSLYNILQTQTMHIAFCIKRIEDCLTFLDLKRNDFESFYAAFILRCESVGILPIHGRSQSNSGCFKDEIRVLYFEVFDNIKEHLKRRYQDMHHLDFFRLLDGSKFSLYADHFDVDLFGKLKTLYPSKFDFDRLKSDLVGVYNTREFRGKSLSELFLFFHAINVIDALPEVYKLLCLCLTIPATSCHVERSFSALKRIKTFSRNCVSEERLTNLAVIAIEKKRLSALQQRKDFHDLVIDEFLKKERRMDFVFK